MKKQLAIAFIQSMLCMPVYAWTINADFDDGNLGARADQGNDGFHGDGSETLYSNAQKLKGNSASISIEQGEEGFGSWGGAFNFPEALGKGDTLWLQVHAYYPKGYDNYSYSAGGRLKFLRIHTVDSSGSHCCYNDIYWEGSDSSTPLAFIFEGQDEWKQIGGMDDHINFDVWESYQIVTTFDTIPVDQGGLAEVRFYKNDQLIGKVTDSKTLNADNHTADFTFLFTYWNGGSPKTQTMWVDEITLTNETPPTLDSEGKPYLESLISKQPVLEEPTRQ
ncbi:hypothetical protein [Reinekea sp. G2M2-21]|uniref:hypothetical protein n=1 Tax=Reinekea sp. G2M2-21 TaxID=2788942 RepID=UPI0018AA28D2|nr:hypothetical protein [Reinekea sp. G2M2-21]